ncbi:hypothetical protein BCY84_13676 [Trypanosoma cruzi cruzi]|nr:hypothetical protein BCY84_13676 [Trypanosoma cruzi cruzi]
MAAGFNLGRILVRLVSSKQDGGELHDVEVFDATMKHMTGWYAVVGSAAVAVVPLLYTSLRALAWRRRALIVRTAQSFSHISADAKAVGQKPSCSPFLPTSRTVLAARRIIDAERATDVEFAKVFSTEVVCAYVDVVFRGLMRSYCRHCMFHVCVFLVCTAVGAHAGGRLASSESAGCCSGSTVTGDTAVSLSVPSLFWRVCFHLRHGALLRFAAEGVSTPYAFFSFSVSTPRMLERCFPWIGVLHDAASRYFGPGVYLDSRWRSPEVADRVWRAMTPKGFAAMWCCRCVTGVLQTNCFRTRNGPAEYLFQGSGKEQAFCEVHYSGEVNAADTEGEREHEPSRMISWLRPLTLFVMRTGKTSMVVFAVTSCASRTNLSWLPFPCAGGPQYVALCYTEMTLMLLSLSFFIFSPPLSLGSLTAATS